MRNKGDALRKSGLIAVLALLSSLILAACGANATNTPVLPSPTAVGTPVQPSQNNPLATSTAGAAPTTAATVATTAAPVATTAAAVATTAAPAKTGGNLKLALPQEPNALDPAKTVLSAANLVNSAIYDRLFYIGKDGLPKPWVAESWQISEGGKVLTFKIRAGLKFHDDTPLDAKAVKFNFDRILDPKTASPTKSFIGALESVEATDELTAVFKFKEAFAPFFTNMSVGYGGLVSPTAVEKFGDQYARNPVGSGPFKFKSWKSGAEIVLERNASYKNYREDTDNKGAPYIDTLTFSIISESATQLAALESGALDIVAPLQPENTDRISKDSRFNVIQVKASTGLLFIDFGDKAPFNTIEFRKAVSHAIDRKTIVESGASGYATANTSPMPNGVAGWDSSLNLYPYDPAKAKQILKDAGWTPGANGILEKEGKPAAYTLLVPGGDAATKRSAEIIQANLKEIGIDAKVQVQEASAVIALLGKGDFDMVTISVGWPDPSFLSLVYKTQNVAFKRAEDKELDAFLTKADTTLDPTQRLALVKEAQKMIMERAKVVPLYTVWLQIAVQKKVQAFKLDALFGYLYNDITLS